MSAVAESNVVPFTPKDDTAITTEVTVTVAGSKALRVTDVDSFARAGDIRVGLAALVKRIKAYFDPDVKRANELHKSLTTKRRQALEPVEAEMLRLDVELGRFKDAEDRRRREAERQASLDAQQQEQQRLGAEASLLEAQGQPELAAAVRQEAAIAPAPAVVVQSEVPTVAGLSFVRPKWRFRIINAALIPRQYMTPDLHAIGSVVDGLKGATRIPGVEVYEDTPGVRART